VVGAFTITYPYDATVCPVCPTTAIFCADNWITSDRKGWLLQRVLNSTNTSRPEGIRYARSSFATSPTGLEIRNNLSM
jgi:hypothetical protein